MASASSNFSASSIANSARRVRQRRRHELEQKQLLLSQHQQQQQQQQQSTPPMVHSPSLSPGASSTSSSMWSSHKIGGDFESKNNNSINNLLPSGTLVEITSSHHLRQDHRNREETRSLSPQSMIMSMSSVHGNVSERNPPISPRVSNSGTNAAATTNATIASSLSFRRSNSSSSSHQRPPHAISPSSLSRSWDEFDNRPPSPSIQRSSSWTLQPKLQLYSSANKGSNHNSNNGNAQQQRHARIVAELGSFAKTTAILPKLLTAHPHASHPIRRVHSSPSSSVAATLESKRIYTATATSAANNINGNNHRPSFLQRSSSGTSSSECDVNSVEGTTSLDAGTLRVHPAHSRVHPAHYLSERPPTPTGLNVSGEEDATSVPGAPEELLRQQQQTINVGCVSPAHSSTSSNNNSVGGNAPSLRLLCQAIQQNGPRPANLSLEEKALWDAMQTLRRQARQEGIQHTKEYQLQQQQQQQLYGSSPASSSSSAHTDATLDTRFVEIREQAVTQQRDNSRSLQAIQRVLADVQAERDQAVLRLQDYYRQPSSLSSHNNNSTSENFTSSVGHAVCGDEKETMQRDLKTMAQRIVSLERELSRSVSDPEIKVTVEPYDAMVESPVSALQPVLDDEVTASGLVQLERDKELLLRELEWKDKEIEQLIQQVADLKVRRDTSDSVDTGVTATSMLQGEQSQLESLRKELSEKSSALENAKMIIVSLENASGSLAAELRRKLRERDDDMSQIQQELTEKQRTLDTLATDLHDLQKVKATSVSTCGSEAAQVKRLQLSSRLETNLAEIRAAAVILESTQDATAVSNLSNLLTDSASALKDGIDVIENGLPEDHSGPLKLHKELEEKKMSIQRLEEILRKQTSEAARYKTTTEDTQRRRDEEVHAFHTEIKILRQQCNTNMEVLTRKERELAVLRDSLRVEDDDVGYISDDEPDDDEQPTMPPPSSTVISEYGPSQAEALARLLSHGGNHSFDSGTAAVAQASAASDQHKKELEALKSELNKARIESEKTNCQLKVEKESLSNAKMIISSLERASKSMMEDLRARLQDSNAAIASLLAKSLESEKTSAKLRLELDSIKREREYRFDVEETALILAQAPEPLLLTETID